jgi:hypothetical protein
MRPVCLRWRRLAKQRDAGRESLVRKALGSAVDEQCLRITMALTAFSAWQAWISTGMKSEGPANIVSDMLVRRINDVRRS